MILTRRYTSRLPDVSAGIMNPFRRLGARLNSSGMFPRRRDEFSYRVAVMHAKGQASNRLSAARLRNWMRREVSSAIVPDWTSCVKVRDTVSMVNPR
jgi:hypothetical protein